MASTSGSSKNLGEHDDRKPGSYQSAAEVVGNLLNSGPGKDGLVLPRKLPESDDAQQETKQDARCQFHISLRG